MAYIGCLGEIPFMVSADTLQTLNNAVWSGSAVYGKHQRHLMDALTEFTGLEPDQFSFNMTLSAYLGVNPMTAITQLWNYERNGSPIPLVIGTKGYGKYRWTITGHKIKMQTMDGQGNLIAAEVSINLLEYIKK